MIYDGITCTMCGAPVESIPASEPGYDALTGSQLDWWWICQAHRVILAPVYGKPSSSEPVEEPEITVPPSAVARLRALRPDLFSGEEIS